MTKNRNRIWDKDDDILTFYLYRYPKCDSITKDSVAQYMFNNSKISEDSLKRRKDSLKRRIDNFRYVDSNGKFGLANRANLTEDVYKEYKNISKDEHKKRCLEIIRIFLTIKSQ